MKCSVEHARALLEAAGLTDEPAVWCEILTVLESDCERRRIIESMKRRRYDQSPEGRLAAALRRSLAEPVPRLED